jgi:hypothetical protein
MSSLPHSPSGHFWAAALIGCNSVCRPKTLRDPCPRPPTSFHAHHTVLLPSALRPAPYSSLRRNRRSWQLRFCFGRCHRCRFRPASSLGDPVLPMAYAQNGGGDGCAHRPLAGHLRSRCCHGQPGHWVVGPNPRPRCAAESRLRSRRLDMPSSWRFSRSCRFSHSASCLVLICSPCPYQPAPDGRFSCALSRLSSPHLKPSLLHAPV